MAAGTPPKAIWGKSFVVSAVEERRQRVLPDGDWIDRQVSRTQEVYISSAGRVFKRERVVAYGGQVYGNSGTGGRRGKRGTLSGSNEQVVGTEGSSRVDVSFRGDTMLLTVVARRGPGARQTAIRYDDAVRSCQATVLQGRGQGEGSVVQRSLVNGREIELQSVKTGDASCQVVDGNVFD